MNPITIKKNKCHFDLKNMNNRKYKKQAIQRLSGFGIDKENKGYFCDKDENNLEYLRMLGFFVPVMVRLRRILKRFQQAGLYLLKNKYKGRALLADDMGLGKSIQSIAYTAVYPKKRPVLIVCPASLTLNWKSEVQKTIPGNPKILVLNNKLPRVILKQHWDYIIVNYTIFPNKYKRYKMYGRTKVIEQHKTGWVDFLIRANIQILIADEAHYCKSNSTAQTKAIKKIGKKIPETIFLTGTPVENSPEDIYNVCSIIKRGMFPSRLYFRKRYCNAKIGDYGWVNEGSNHEKELHRLLTSQVMIRRKKSEVLTELPPKQRVVIPVDIPNRAVYERAKKDIVSYIKEEKGVEGAIRAARAQAIVRINTLKKIVADGKLASVTKWVKDFLSQRQKLVLFCHHIDIVESFKKAFSKNSVVIRGGMSAKEKEAAVYKFQKDPKTTLMIANLKAGSVGLNLTAASATAHVEFGWTSTLHDQAEDRVHRIGQEADSVLAYYFVAVETIEEKITELIDKKRKISSSIVDGKKVKGALSIKKDLIEWLRAQ